MIYAIAVAFFARKIYVNMPSKKTTKTVSSKNWEYARKSILTITIMMGSNISENPYT